MSTLTTLSATTYAAIGTAGVLAPDRVFALFGGSAASADSRTELRAVYGGMPLAVAGLLLTRPRSSALPAAVLSAGMAAARAAGMWQEGNASALTKVSLATEAGLAVALAAAARRSRKPSKAR